MGTRWILASFHLLALGIGLGGVWVRGRALRGPLDGAGVRRVLAADNAWGIAALLWLATGLVRLFGGFEKGLDYYLHSRAFLTKMFLFVAILGLEIWPMTTFIGWRIRLRRGDPIDTSRGRTFARISVVQALLVVGMVFLAVAVARGLGGG
jgi:putative membrane protein